MAGEWGGYANGRIPKSAMRQLEHATYNGQPSTAFRLRKDAAMALDRLLLMAKADGYDTDITDAYRDYATQVRLKATKGVYAAKPGTSNHGLAMAGDLAYHAGPKSFGRWMWANEKTAREHGWYPPGWTHDGRGIEEPWHWEYDPDLDQHRYEEADDMALSTEDKQWIKEQIAAGAGDTVKALLATDIDDDLSVRLALRKINRRGVRTVDLILALANDDKATAKEIVAAIARELAD